jgi:prepilin signal peptidase PulO-like enzyme (type II secretory pathway)
MAIEEQPEKTISALAIAWRVALGIALLATGYLLAGTVPRSLLHGIYAVVLLTIVYTDIRQHRVPNLVVYPAIVFACGVALSHPEWWKNLLGGVVAAILLTIPVFIYGPERAGIGDIKMALFMGLILGFSMNLYWALLIAFAAGALVGGIGILLGKLHRKSTLPFAAFLGLGTIVVLFLGA